MKPRKIVGPLPPATWHGEILVEYDDTHSPHYLLKMHVNGCLVLVPTAYETIAALTETMHRAREEGDKFNAKETTCSVKSGLLHVKVGDHERIIT